MSAFSHVVECGMRIAAHGYLPDNDTPRTVVWTDGEVSGDRLAIGHIQALVQYYEGAPVGPPEGPFTLDDHLSDPVSFCTLVEQAFDVGVKFTGETPEIVGSTGV